MCLNCVSVCIRLGAFLYVPMRAGSYIDPRNWSSLESQVVVSHSTWVLGTEVRSFVRAVCLLTSERSPQVPSQSLGYFFSLFLLFGSPDSQIHLFVIEHSQVSLSLYCVLFALSLLRCFVFPICFLRVCNLSLYILCCHVSMCQIASTPSCLVVGIL